MKRLIFWCAAVLLAAALPAHAQLIDSSRNWRTAETAHFRIHFEDEVRATATRVGDIAERAHALVTRELAWTPGGKVDIVLYSGVDLANGFATPLPFNLSGIFLTAPSEGELIDRAEWLELVILHELTHIVHLDKAEGAPGGVRRVFGRILWTFPNALQPTWVIEGLAVHSESRIGNGVGRLRSPHFEAQMRDERRRGFMSLREINADGRRAPLNRNYLYGGYFFDYLIRTYGKDAAVRYVSWYSRQLLPFRLNNSTYELTDKPMDVVWSEFLADLTREIDTRAAPVLAQPQRIGDAVRTPWFDIDDIAVAPNGDLYVAASDGVGAPALRRYRPGAARAETLARLNPFARIRVGADGAVLIAQPEMCRSIELLYDLYVWRERGGLTRLTHCGRMLHATWFGTEGRIAAIRNNRAGATEVVLVKDGAVERTLLAAESGRQWLDIAAAPDGGIVLIGKRAGRFEIVRFDPVSGARRVLHADEHPKSALHVGADGAIGFIATAGGVPNVWRLVDDSLSRVTHAHTAVTQFGGAAADGSLALAVLADGKSQLQRIGAAAPLDTQRARDAQVAAPALLPPAAANVALADERRYNPLPSLLPRAWFPVTFADKGTFALGASIFGADALGQHAYLLTPLYEFTQGEFLGLGEYVYRNRHFISFERELEVKRWTGDEGDEDPLEYETVGRAQWVSLARWQRLQRQAALGVGAALARSDRVIVDGAATRTEDERLAAVIAQYDSRAGGVLADGYARGQQAQLFYETYRPFKNEQRGLFNGEVARALWDGYLPLGRTVLAGNWVEARRLSGRTEPFQLGGSFSGPDRLAPSLNERKVTLRGYDNNLPQLSGANARRVTLEWRTPIADIDRHAMVPPVGVNRVSGVVFYEAGGVWDRGGGPEKWYRGAGVEAVSEVRLGFIIPLQVRIGVARGLDEPGQTRGYIHAGRNF
jgi:hypothetical protein